MGTGIGKECERCAKQLNYDDGFNADETLCKSCDSIVRYDARIRRSERPYVPIEKDYDS